MGHLIYLHYKKVRGVFGMLEFFLLSITSFLGTSIDDLIVNIIFFSSTKSKKEQWHIVIGKYLGLGTLLLVSLLASLGFGFLPMKAIGCLGLIPIALGVKALLSSQKQVGPAIREAKPVRGGSLIFQVALITAANGADNISVYIPLFAGFSAAGYAVFCGVFLWMTALWCVLGHWIAKLPLLRDRIEPWKKWIMPAVYVLLGVYILCKGLR